MVNIAILGFGVVGSGTAEVLTQIPLFSWVSQRTLLKITITPFAKQKIRSFAPQNQYITL